VIFKQCAARRKNNERCNRTASQGRDYCWSHRNCKPKRDYSHLDPFKNLHIEFSGKYEPIALCQTCGEAVHEGLSLKHGNEEFFVCIRCGKYELEIEDRISKVCALYPGGVYREKIIEDLDKFGVPEELTEIIWKRMLNEGRLAEI